jgi:hypothetical protein
MIRINIYRAGEAWYGARWVNGEWDGCDELDVPAGATEQEAREEALRMPLRTKGERTVTRVEDQ